MRDNKSLKVKVQRFGGFLSSMIMPNIGAFIAWGIITAFVIPTGWTPNEQLLKLVGPSLSYLLPLLIAFTGGNIVHGKRGGVIAAIATMGVVIGSDLPMLIGAMVMAPAAAYILKKVDNALEGKIKPGFEMLVDNFTLGIIAAILMILGFLIVQPIFTSILNVLSAGVDWVVTNQLTPFAAVFVAPAQVLFLNNAINHGIMVPLGTAEVLEKGKSILFFVEANNGPLSGVLLAYMFFGKGIAKKTAFGAWIIALFGGIGEVYFPFVLMKPKMILGTILGSMTSLFIFQSFGGGAVAAPSPGSIFAFMMVSPKDSFFLNLFGFFAGMGVAFLVSAFLLKNDKSVDDDEYLEESFSTMTGSNGAIAMSVSGATTDSLTKVKNIYVCCDAGMGSSAMGANILKSKATKAGLDVVVKNKSLNANLEDADMIITLDGLVERAKAHVKKEGVIFVGINNFLDETVYVKIIKSLE